MPYRPVIRVPFGKGIAGHVALTGETLNVDDAYSCPLFHSDVDKETGFRTRSVLCCPVKDTSGKMVAVLEVSCWAWCRGVHWAERCAVTVRCEQALNKHAGHFTALDQKALEMFGVHIGNSLSMARLHATAMYVPSC